MNKEDITFNALIIGAIYLLVFMLGCVQEPEEAITTIQTTTVSAEVDIYGRI